MTLVVLSRRPSWCEQPQRIDCHQHGRAGVGKNRGPEPGDADVAARIAEKRLGMSSLGLHGAHDVSKFMPQTMQEIGSGMHRAASQFAVIAMDSGVTGDLQPALAALANVTAQCVGCHAGYRIK